MQYNNCIFKWNESTMKALVWECITKPNYQALFITNNTLTKALVREWLKMMLSYGNIKLNQDSALFPNGSRIKIIGTNTTARGYRVHRIVIDDDVDTYTIDTVFKPMIRDYIEETKGAVIRK